MPEFPDWPNPAGITGLEIRMEVRKMWKILRPFFTILVFSLSVQNVSFCQQSDPCEGKLPEQVQAEVQTKFGGWRIETKEDLSDDHKQMWEKTHSRECPGLASGHFRSPRDLSFAILLISKDPKIVGYRLLVADPGSQNGH